MPNWCLNRLRVDGPPSEVKRFFEGNLDLDEATMLSFERSVPTQAPTKDWGTKWDACNVIAGGYNGYGTNIDDEAKTLSDQLANGASLSYAFDTAWSPPIEWLARTAPKYHKLQFTLSFAEPGMDFCGEHTFSGTEVSEMDYNHLDYKFCEDRGLLNWPCCDYCGNRLDESRIYDEFCPGCEEQEMMSRGRAA